MSVSHYGEDWATIQISYNDQNGINQLRTVAVDAEAKKVILSDEIFWNEHSVTGEDLEFMAKIARELGYEVGITITPAAVIDGKCTVEQLADAIKLVDFVGVDPYTGLGVKMTDAELIAFTHAADDIIESMGKESMLILQGFAQAGQEAETLAFVAEQLKGHGYDSLAIFGAEDGPDLVGFVGINEQVIEMIAGSI